MAAIDVSNVNEPPTSAGDAELIARARAGDMGSFGELYERHVQAAIACARAVTRSRNDADDIVNEAFTRVLNALRNSGGPEVAFRPYLLASVRNVAYDRARRSKRVDIVEEVDRVAPISLLSSDTDFGADAERNIIAKAYSSLPERWRMVLWHTEVEGMNAAEVAPLLGIAPNAVAALAYRAREGLRQAYLQAHVIDSENADCNWAIDRMSAYTRDRLPGRERLQLDEHLESCGRCRDRLAEITHVNTALRLGVLPLVVGPGAAAGYLKAIGASSATAAHFGSAREVAQRAAKRIRDNAAASVAVAATVAMVSLGIGIAVSRSDTGSSAEASRPSDASAKKPAVVTDPGSSSSEESSSTTTTTTSSTTTSSSSSAPAAVSSAPRTSPPPAVPVVATPDPVASTPTPPTSQPVVVVPLPPSPPSTPPDTSTSSAVPIAVDTAANVELIGEQVQGRSGALFVAVTNNGPNTATNIPVIFKLAGGTSIVPETNNGTCTAGVDAASCVLTSLATGAREDIVVRYDTPVISVNFTAQTTASGDTNSANDGVVASFSRIPAGVGPAFVTIDRGDFVQAGNASLSCNTAVLGCADARNRVGASLSNNGWNMVQVDSDADLTTFNSSDASVSIPPAATVMWAGLYWGADTSAGAGGTVAPNSSDVSTVKFTTPVGGSNVTAAAITRDIVATTKYQGFADVTNLVRAAGSGTYTVANIQAGTGIDRYAGWSLVVAYRDASLPVRTLYAFDGLRRVASGTPVVTHLSGFRFTSGGRAVLGVTTYEGDAGVSGDSFKVGATTISNGTNPATDTFNSSVTRNGAEVLDRLPSDRNTFGFDLDLFEIAPGLSNGDIATDLTFSTSSDVYFVGSITVAVDR